MATPVAIVGESGKGKSTSIFKDEELEHIGLDPKDTIIINVSGKPLPIRGGDKLFPNKGTIAEGRRQYKNLSVAKIIELFNSCDTEYKDVIRNIVIDDAQYLQGFEFMNRASEKGFEKFTDLGKIGFSPVRTAMKLKTNPDLTIFFLYHSTSDNKGNTSIKTSGKLIDQHITMEGLFTIVLFCKTEINLTSNKVEYFFETNTDSTNTAKSPRGMFETQNIPNDLGFVAKKIREYYE